MVFSLSLCTAGSVLAASPAPSPRANNASPTKGKLISFNIRNDAAQPLTIKAGDQQMTIAPGAKMSMKLEKGVQVTTVNDTTHLHAGDVLTTVTEFLQGNTLAVA